MHLKDLGNLKNVKIAIDGVFSGIEKITKNNFNNTVSKLEDSLSDYSLEAVKATVSQVALTKAQATAIFTAKGLSGAELDAAVKAASLSASQKEATTSTLGLGAAFKGLGIFIKQATVSMVKFLTQTPAGWATLVIAALYKLSQVSNKVKKHPVESIYK